MLPMWRVCLRSGVSMDISDEDYAIVDALKNVTRKLQSTYSKLNETDDLCLIDGYIYEILALNKQYEYYNKLCKNHQVVAQGF
jgi:hypothetical protein